MSAQQLHDAKELSVVYDVLGSLNGQAWSLVPMESLPTVLQVHFHFANFSFHFHF
jgi:hypothetical protein